MRILHPLWSQNPSGRLFFFIPLTNLASTRPKASQPSQPIFHCQVDSVAKHACAVCLETYQTDSALHQHAVEAQHQAYQCKCGTGFNKASALKRHIDTKNASKTFACTLCHDKFTRKDKLKDHCRHYHRAMDHGLQFLFTSQEIKPQAAAPSRRRRALARKPVASSGHPAPILRPAHAPATAGPSAWSIAASTGQQYAGLLADTSAPTGAPATTSAFPFPDSSFVPVGQFVTSADAFAINPALDEDILGQLDDFFGNGIQAMSFNVFN